MRCFLTLSILAYATGCALALAVSLAWLRVLDEDRARRRLEVDTDWSMPEDWAYEQIGVLPGGSLSRVN